MADKEEKICVCKLEGNATDSVCGGSITRQEAVEKIARALCVADGVVDCKECIYRGTDNCKTQLKNWYLKDAEIALDALLNIEE